MNAKLPKSKVFYRRATGSQRCGNCSMFRPPRGYVGPASCTLVEGSIDANDVCDRWEKKPPQEAA